MQEIDNEKPSNEATGTVVIKIPDSFPVNQKLVQLLYQ